MPEGNLTHAIRLVGIFTAGRFDLWNLAGDQNAPDRAAILSALTGQWPPRSKAGVTALRTALYAALEITGTCEAHRQDNFAEAARAIVASLHTADRERLAALRQRQEQTL